MSLALLNPLGFLEPDDPTPRAAGSMSRQLEALFSFSFRLAIDPRLKVHRTVDYSLQTVTVPEVLDSLFAQLLASLCLSPLGSPCCLLERAAFFCLFLAAFLFASRLSPETETRVLRT